MVVVSGFVKPTNKVIVMGKPELQEYTAEEAGITPGMVIMSGTTQDLCKIYTVGAGKGALGFAGYEQSYQGGADVNSIYTRNRPEGLTAAYANAAKIPVLFMSNMVLLSKMAPGSAAVKGDLLAAYTGGLLVAGQLTRDGFAVRVPFVENTTETATGLIIPAGAVINDVFINVGTNAAGSSIDVGLLETGDDAEVGGDADGFLDGESCAATGRVQHVQFNTDATKNTLGAYLTAGDIKSGDSSALFYSVPKQHVGDGVAKTLTYTTSNHAVAGDIFVVFDNIEVVGKAVETVTAGAAVMVQALI